MCVFVHLFDLLIPLHVGPPALEPLTHIMKAKGPSASIQSHEDEGRIIICIICLTRVLSQRLPHVCASSSSVVGGLFFHNLSVYVCVCG